MDNNRQEPSVSSLRAAQQLAYLIVLAGVFSSTHIWKLAPALPMIRDELGMNLVTAGFLLSLVQFAGMCLGLLTGMTAEKMGMRRAIIVGLLLLGGASVASVVHVSVTSMLLWRALEGLGFLLIALSGPAMIRQLVPPEALGKAMGVWGTFMPTGSVTILVVGAWVLSMANWRVLWLGLGLATLLMAVVIWKKLPADVHRRSGDDEISGWRTIGLVLGSPNMWLIAAMFGLYAGQWVAIIGFLPTIYALAGISGTVAGVLTAIVAGANAIGCFYAGRLLHRGFTPRTLVLTGYSVMILTSIVAFGLPVPVWVQFAAILTFSTVGGLVPTTMFYSVVKLAPSAQTTSASIGWMQQLSSLGQFSGPPIVAWVVTLSGGGWHNTWVATSSAAVLGMLAMWVLSARVRAGRSTLQ